MIKINIITSNKDWKKIFKNPKNYLKKKILHLNKTAFFKRKNLEFSILLTGSKEIKEFNKKFRKKNKITDVLSFPFQEKKLLKKILKKKHNLYLGDIAINFDRVISKDIKLNFKKSFDRLWVHGLVHLLGGRHSNNKEYIKMKKIENKFFKAVN